MSSKKKVLGVDPLSWIKQSKLLDLEAGEKKPGALPDAVSPKYQSYDVKLTIRISEQQLSYLSNLEREIMKSRSKENKKERITKNSIIRVMISVLSDLEFDHSEIPDEEFLFKRMSRSIK